MYRFILLATGNTFYDIIMYSTDETRLQDSQEKREDIRLHAFLETLEDICRRY